MRWIIILSTIWIICFKTSNYILKENRYLGCWFTILWLVSLMMLIKIYLVFYGIL